MVGCQISIRETRLEREADRDPAYRQQGKSGRCFNKSTAKSRFRKASKTAS
jgi:hypothetical protein